MTALLNSEGILGVAANATDSYTPPACILAGDFPVEVSAGTLLDPSGDLPAFSLIGRITTGGKLTLSVQTAVDGSQVPIGITTTLVKDSGGDQPVVFYRTGKFNYNAINKDASWTSLALLRKAVEAIGQSLFFAIPGTATPTEPS
jgi:head decoration protein D